MPTALVCIVPTQQLVDLAIKDRDVLESAVAAVRAVQLARDPALALQLAVGVPRADRRALEAVVVAAKDPKVAYMWATAIPGANLRSLGAVVASSSFYATDWERTFGSLTDPKVATYAAHEIRAALKRATECDPLVPRHRILAWESCGVVELPVVVLSGIISEDARRVLRGHHIRMDRSVGVYQVIANQLLWGLRGEGDMDSLQASYEAASGDRAAVHDMLVLGPKLFHQGYTYGLLVPRLATTGFFVDQWVPGPSEGPAHL